MVYLSSYKSSINMRFVSNRSKARYLVVQPSLDLRLKILADTYVILKNKRDIWRVFRGKKCVTNGFMTSLYSSSILFRIYLKN